MSDKGTRFNKFLAFNGGESRNGLDNTLENGELDTEFEDLQIDTVFNPDDDEPSTLHNINPEKDQPSLKYADSLSYQTFPIYEIQDMFYCENNGNLVQCFGKFTFVWSCSKLIVLKDGADWKTIETFVPRDFDDSDYDRDDLYDSNYESSVDYDSDFGVQVVGGDNPPPPRIIFERDDTPVESIIAFTPHTVHSIRVSKLRSKDVLSVCVSDGRVVLYDITNFDEDNATLSVIMVLNFNFLSRTCISFYGDYIVIGGFYHFTLIYYKDERHIYYVKTDNELDELYSDVEITHATDNEIWVTAVTSRGGDLSTYVFENIKSETQIEEAYELSEETPYLKVNISQDVQLKNHTLKFKKIENQVKHLGSGLTVNSISRQCFKSVQNINQMGSNHIDITRILKNGLILGFENEPFNSRLNDASQYQTIQVSTSATQTANSGVSAKSFEGIIPLQDKIKQIELDYFKEDAEKAHIPKILSSKLLIVTNKNHIAIFTSDSLLCLAETSVVFPIVPNVSNIENRLVMVKLIPELSALVVVSQIGFLSIFRLVEYKGLFSLRQEFVYPLENWKDKMESPIIGIDVRKVREENDDTDVYWCYLMDIDSHFVKFELKENESDYLDMEFI